MQPNSSCNNRVSFSEEANDDSDEEEGDTLEVSKKEWERMKKGIRDLEKVKRFFQGEVTMLVEHILHLMADCHHFLIDCKCVMHLDCRVNWVPQVRRMSRQVTQCVQNVVIASGTQLGSASITANSTSGKPTTSKLTFKS